MAKKKTNSQLLSENTELQSEIKQLKDFSKLERESLLRSHTEEKESLNNGWTEKYESQKSSFENKIKKIEEEKKESENQWEEKTKSDSIEFEGKIKALEDEKDSVILDLVEKNKALEFESKNKQKQIDFQETKKLAKAYEDQKREYRSNSIAWFNRLTFVVSVLAISTIASFIFARRVVWHERLEYYLIDFILISAVWFCAKQYSYYIQLYSDFANRQALAQSYHNITNSVEDSDIKEKFIDKMADILCMKNVIGHKDNLPVEKLLSTVLETLNTISKKIK